MTNAAYPSCEFKAYRPAWPPDEGDATHAESSREADQRKRELRATLDELVQRGALKMLHEALKAEVDEYIRRHRDARDDRGRAQVVRNGKAPARQLVTGSGTLQVPTPRIDDRRVRRGASGIVSREILPSYMRKDLSAITSAYEDEDRGYLPYQC